jgi:hypothetical protein
VLPIALSRKEEKKSGNPQYSERKLLEKKKEDRRHI